MKTVLFLIVLLFSFFAHSEELLLASAGQSSVELSIDDKSNNLTIVLNDQSAPSVEKVRELDNPNRIIFRIAGFNFDNNLFSKIPLNHIKSFSFKKREQGSAIKFVLPPNTIVPFKYYATNQSLKIVMGETVASSLLEEPVTAKKLIIPSTEVYIPKIKYLPQPFVESNTQELKKIQFIRSELAENLLKFSFTAKPHFTLSSVANNQYLLQVKGFSLASEQQALPYYAPQYFDGLNYIVASSSVQQKETALKEAELKERELKELELKSSLLIELNIEQGYRPKAVIIDNDIEVRVLPVKH